MTNGVAPGVHPGPVTIPSMTDSTTLDGAGDSMGEAGTRPADAAQFAARWNARTTEQRERLARIFSESLSIANRCEMQDHDGYRIQHERDRELLATYLATYAARMGVIKRLVKPDELSPEVDALDLIRLAMLRWEAADNGADQTGSL